MKVEEAHPDFLRESAWPASRSEALMIAVGFSPRLEVGNQPPRIATLEDRGCVRSTSRSLFEPAAAHPKRTVSSSPGLRGTSYPGSGESECPNPNGVVSFTSRRRHNPVGVDANSATVSQGSSVRAGLANLATLGFEPESRWDSIPDARGTERPSY